MKYRDGVELEVVVANISMTDGRGPDTPPDGISVEKPGYGCYLDYGLKGDTAKLRGRVESSD